MSTKIDEDLKKLKAEITRSDPDFFGCEQPVLHDEDDELRQRVTEEERERRKRYYYYAGSASGGFGAGGDVFPYQFPYKLR